MAVRPASIPVLTIPAGLSGWPFAAILACAYLFVHVLLNIAFADISPVASYGILIATPVLAAIACAGRARAGSQALNRYALALSLILWATGMATTLYMDVFTADSDLISGLSTLFFSLYGVPLTFILASPAEEGWPARLIDGVLSLVLGGLFFACAFTFSGLDTGSEADLLSIRLLYDIQNLFIAVFSYVRYKASAGAEKRFFRDTAIFATVYMAMAAYINHMESDTAYGALNDAVIDIPFLALLFLTLLRSSRSALASASAGAHFRLFVQAASPLVLPLTLFAMSCVLLFHKPVYALTGLLFALLGYGARNILVQMQTLTDRNQLRQLSLIDPLTHLFNRRAFDEALTREFQRALRSDKPLSLLMVDIDHFKSINDTYGHPEGDRYLQMVALCLSESAGRASDIVARYGGEEFAVILPETDGAHALTVAQKILHAISALDLPSPAQSGHVTVSIGLAASDQSQTPEAQALLKAADAALYRAKQGGRNRVI
ncbi:MAG: GGDEF domain-containing protein [Asticcacaulis sp.]